MRRLLVPALLAAVALSSPTKGLLAQAGRSVPLPFDLRLLPLFAIGLAVMVGVPFTALIGRWSGWRRLAERYPDRNTGRGTSFRSGPVIMSRSVYKMGVRFTMDDSHLHFAMPAINRPGHPPFSVPWSDIEVTPDEWPWFPFRNEPMGRFTLAGAPDLRILVKLNDVRWIADASGGRLELTTQGGPR